MTSDCVRTLGSLGMHHSGQRIDVPKNHFCEAGKSFNVVRTRLFFLMNGWIAEVFDLRGPIGKVFRQYAVRGESSNSLCQHAFGFRCLCLESDLEGFSEHRPRGIKFLPPHSGDGLHEYSLNGFWTVLRGGNFYFIRKYICNEVARLFYISADVFCVFGRGSLCCSYGHAHWLVAVLATAGCVAISVCGRCTPARNDLHCYFFSQAMRACNNDDCQFDPLVGGGYIT